MSNASNQTPLRERVERGIYRRKTKDGRTRYEVAYVEDGRQRWKTVESDRLQDARAERAEIVTKLRRGERVTPTKATLAEYAEQWLEGQAARLRPSTHARYEVSLRPARLSAARPPSPPGRPRRRRRPPRRRVGARHPLRRARRSARRDEGEAARGLDDPRRPGRARPVLASAERQGAIVSNPVRKLDRSERPRVRRTEFPVLDVAAIGRLIAATPKRYRCLVAVSVLTGLRQSEALGLRWRDVDVKAGTISVSRQLDRAGSLVELKTDAARRTVPIPPSLVRMLRAHKAEAFERGRAGGEDFVFASETGRPLGHRNVGRRGLDKATAATNLPRLRWHDLRHLTASVLIGEGAPPSYVATVLGHASPAITLSIYAHVFAEAEHAERTRDRMEAAFGKVLA